MRWGIENLSPLMRKVKAQHPETTTLTQPGRLVLQGEVSICEQAEVLEDQDKPLFLWIQDLGLLGHLTPTLEIFAFVP